MTILPQLLLGLSLASAAGLRAFLPLLVLSAAAHFHVVHLNGQFAWLQSWTALVVLGTAAVAEVLADKIPVVDHALDAVQTLVRPAAGALAMASTQSHFDPVTAGVLGLIMGAPLAGTLHAAKGGTRLASTATTAGLANPFLSLAEDTASAGLSLLAVFVPYLAALFALVLFYGLWRVWRKVRGLKKQKATGA